jgi:5-methylthioribose kinase
MPGSLGTWPALLDAAMKEITAENAADYLRQTGRANATDQVDVRELTGGVSNAVYYVTQRATSGAETRFVLKQARPQLRVAQPWFCSVERNWRELSVLRTCQSVLDRTPLAPDLCTERELAATTPAVLWEDRENFAFAMTAAPPEHVVWKQLLLQGDLQDEMLDGQNRKIAEACGRLLARLHSGSWQGESIRRELGNTELFDALRVDPYYRTVATIHADLHAALEPLIHAHENHPRAVVHADFSPKNLLVYRNGDRTELMMVDFETGHFGDPAFDVGFFLTHLVLKTFLFADRGNSKMLMLGILFWSAYFAALGEPLAEEKPSLRRRAMQHLGGCVLARLDGKSPVEYLDEPRRREAARAFARRLLLDPADDWGEANIRLIESMSAVR